MMSKGKRKSVAGSWTVAFILVCYLVQMLDGYRLRKAGRQRVASDKPMIVQEGNIVFGRVFEKGSGFEAEDIKKSNASVEDDSSYQADFAGKMSCNQRRCCFKYVMRTFCFWLHYYLPTCKLSWHLFLLGWPKSQSQDASPKDASWKRLGTNLQCGGDQMKFTAVGPGASQFAVEQGKEMPF